MMLEDTKYLLSPVPCLFCGLPHCPGQSIGAIKKMAPRLVQWSIEPEPTFAVCNMFGLVAGEDRLFANAILLRLVNAFVEGDKDIRLAVVKVFLTELRSRGKLKRNNPYRGILSRARVHNHSELIKRVKAVIDAGDVESKAMVLVLFGCWADFAKDSAYVRYLVLSSMVSSDAFEVKASLFAAGCICELASDFSSVVLEMVANLLSSLDTSLTVKLAGARLFSKLCCSYSVSNGAYKLGREFAIKSSEENVLAAMLVSLSKLSLRWTILLSEQVDFLLSFCDTEKSLSLISTSVRCLHFIFVAVHHPVGAQAIKTLLKISDDDKLPAAMQCEVLHIVHKMLLCLTPGLIHQDILEFVHVMEFLEKLSDCPLPSKCMLAICILVDMSVKLRQEAKMVTGAARPFPITTVPTTIDRIFQLLKTLSDLSHSRSETSQEIQGLLIFLLRLVRDHPDQGILVLDKLRYYIEYLLDVLEGLMHGVDSDLSCGVTMDFSVYLKLLCNVQKLVVSCIELLNKCGALTIQVLEKIKLLRHCTTQCRWFHIYGCVIYSILSHSETMWSFVVNKNEEACTLAKNYENALCIDLFEHEAFTLGFVKELFNEKDKWPAYKAGKFAALQGAWSTAAFIFEQLTDQVQSDSFRYWMKSLSQFAQSEIKIRLLILASSKDWSLMKDIAIERIWNNFVGVGRSAMGNISEFNQIDALVAAYQLLCSSEETLQFVSTFGSLFCFQSWFMSLRIKLLRSVIDFVKILDNIKFNEDNITVDHLDSVHQITNKSLQLKGLAEEFDLIARSFISIDRRSSQIISSLALRCSVLAFTAGFALFIPNLLTCGSLTASGMDLFKLKCMLTQDLFGRIGHSDGRACLYLFQLLDVDGLSKVSFDLQPRNQTNQTTYSCGEMREILNLCDYAITGVVGLHDVAKRMDNDATLSGVTNDALKLLSRTLKRWMQIPFWLPKYFFRVRPCIGSELFVSNLDVGKQNELSILSGSHLSLNLCLQLWNVPLDLQFQPKKLYCILQSSVSWQEPRPSRETTGQERLDYRSWKTDNMIQMNKKILHHITEHSSNRDRRKCDKEDDSVNDGGVVEEIVCFELYRKWQGFASCLFDVSDFPVGSYRINWHSCCIDGQNSYWSLLPFNSGPVFTVQDSHLGG